MTVHWKNRPLTDNSLPFLIETTILIVRKGDGMSEHLGTKLGEWLFTQGMIEKNQIDLSRYSFEIMCSEIAENIIIFGYGLLSKKLIFTLMYLIFFHTLRHYFQGYHAKTITRCFALTIGAYLTALCLFTSITYGWGVLFLIISLSLQIMYCVKKQQLMPMLISIVLKVTVLTLAAILHDFSFFQLLIIVELIVSVSALLRKED